MSSVVQKLQAGRELVAKPNGWTQGVEARDSFGFTVDADSEYASCWCAIGALRRVTESVPRSTYVFTKCVSLLRKAAGTGVVGWNDQPGRTQVEVVDAFDRAVVLAEQEVEP